MARGKGKAGRLVVWIIVGLLVVGLAGFGVSSFGGGTARVGRVGDVEITAVDYARALQNELRRIGAETGQAMPFAEAQGLGLDRAVLQRLVGEAALDAEAARLGLSAGDDQVREAILRIESFQAPDGSFSRDAYAFGLDRIGMTPAAFEEEIRRETARNLLQSAVAGAVATPSAFVDTLFAYAREARDISWVAFTPATLAEAVPVPGEQQARAYHAANPIEFTTPEVRAITYAWLSPDAVAPTIAIDEAALRTLYGERLAEYVQPERRLVERLVFGSPEEAAEASARIRLGGTSFDALVAARDLTLADVDLGEVARIDLGAAADAVFALEGPGIAGPVETPLGPALFRVNAVLAAQETPFEAVRAELQAEFVADRARRLVADRIDQIDDLLAGGATLEEIAAEAGMTLGQIGYRPGVSEGIAAYPAFREAAETVAPDAFPEVRELDDGGIFAFRLDAVEPPAVEPFEAVRERAVAAWTQAETRRRLVDAAEAARTSIEAGGAAPELAFTAVTGLFRDGFVEALPDGAVAELFALEPGAAGVFATPEGAVLARVDRVVPADGAGAEAQGIKAAFAQAAAQGIALDLLQAYTRALEAEFGMRLDGAALNAVHARLQ